MIDKHWCRWDEHDCEAAYEESERLRNTIKNCPPVSESEYVRRLESENERLQGQIDTLRELRKFDRAEIERLRALEPKP